MSPFFTATIIVLTAVFTVFMLKKGINLGLLMLLDSVPLALLARVSAADAIKFGIAGALSPDTIKLVVLLFLIMMLENIMRTEGLITRMVDNLKELMGSNRVSACLMPAVIGLLPSPGGARFSCPMVDDVVGKNAQEDGKAFVNYWFRHIWMDGFILYPGIILVSELVGIPVISIFLHMIPLMLLAALIGGIAGSRLIKKETIVKTRPYRESLRGFITAMLPVITLIAVYMLLINATPYSLEIASISVVAGMFIIRKFSFRRILSTAREAFPVRLVAIIFGVMAFKEILLESGVMSGLPEMLSSRGIPVEALYILLPLVTGFSTGMTISFISMSFPILLPLGVAGNIWHVVIVFAVGSVGIMVSPLHLCAVMSADYFKTALSRLLSKIAAAEASMLAALVLVLYITTIK